MVKIKTFIEALSFYHADFKKFQRYLQDKRLSQAEKTILRAWINLREVKLQKIISELAPLKTFDKEVEAQRQLLLGIAYNNTGELLHAVPTLLHAIGPLKDSNLPNSYFAAINTLFITYHNLKDLDGMARVLEEMVEFEKPTTGQQIEILRRQFSFFCFIGKLDKARLIMKKIDKYKKYFSDAQKINLLMDKFDLAIKADSYKVCEEILSEMKNHRNFQLSANFKFMRKLLSLITTGESLYLYPKDFAENPQLCAQVKVLLAMEQGNYEDARREWLQLSKMSPSIFDKDFGYHGDKCLFSVAINKLQPKKEILFAKKGEMNNEALFLKIMTEHQGIPISKEELFYEMWGKELESKDDLNKLVCTVYRLKTKHKLTIKSRKGCYILEKAHLKKAA